MPDQRSLNVLLVEDNTINQKVFGGYLESGGHRVTIAENGLRAVEAVEDHTFDVVLMDIDMPGLDGLEATQAIRAMGGTNASMPIVALTSNGDDGVREQCLTAGMTGFLSKPVPKATLLNVVRRAVAGFGRSGGPEHPGSGRRTLEGHVLDELEQSLGRDEFVRLLATFRRSTAEKVALLEEALGAGRRKEVGSLAHDLKGAAASVGAGLLADAAAAVVEACRAGDAARARTGIEDLRARAVETLRELESRPHTIGAG